MTDRIRMGKIEVLAKGWSSLTSYAFEYLGSNGKWQNLTREIHDHGNAAAVLLINKKARSVVLVRQFRLPVHLEQKSGFFIEVVAGLLDEDAPEACIRREAVEETGYEIFNPQLVFEMFGSPGAIREKSWCFIAEYDPANRLHNGGGLDHEGEDIEVLEMPFDTALEMIGTGDIQDAKTIMLLQHAALHNLV